MAHARTLGRCAVVLLLVLGALIAWVHRDALDPLALAQAIKGYPSAALLFAAIQIAAGLVFVPRTFTGVAAGLIFGPRWGFVWLMLGTVLGSAAGFLLARIINAGAFEPATLPRIGPLLGRAEHWEWRSVAAFRLIPGIPYSVSNYALGLTRIKLGHYLVGSCVGQMPSTAIYVLLGGTGAGLLQGGSAWLSTVVVDAAFLLPLSVVILLKLRPRTC